MTRKEAERLAPIWAEHVGRTLYVIEMKGASGRRTWVIRDRQAVYDIMTGLLDARVHAGAFPGKGLQAVHRTGSLQQDVPTDKEVDDEPGV